VNCLVPAKLGDLYRAYLLKINTPVSLSRTFGTVFIERVLDLFAIVVLGLGAGYWSFRSGLPPEVQILFAIGVIVVVILAVALLTMRNFGRRVLTRLPLPHRVLELYDRFEEGVFGALRLRQLPTLVVVTGLIWATEAMRLFLVVEAMGFSDVHIGISGAFFVALTASLLTAVPLTPAGIGFVEGAVVGLLTFVYGIGQTEALAIVLVDRAISVLSVILPFAFFPFGVYIAYIYYSTAVPRDLLDAARIDGCGEWSTFWRIALPLARPVVALVFFFSFVADWNNFFLPYAVLAESSQYPIQVGLSNLLGTTPSFNPAVGGGGQQVNIFRPELALATLLAVIPVAVVFMLSQRALVRGLVAGAVKS